MNRYRIVDVCEHLTFRYQESVKMYSCGCCPTAHKGLKSPKRFTNLPEINTDIGLNCESQGEKGRTCKKYKILIGSCVFFFHFIHDFLFSPGHLLKKKKKSMSSLFSYFEIVSFFTKYCIQNCIILIMLLHPFTNIFTCL